jgi:hypothetical protein
VLANDESMIWGTSEVFIQKLMLESNMNDIGGSICNIGHNYDMILLGIAKSGVTLSPFGYVFINESLRQKMLQRLGLVQFIARHPQIEAIQLHKPIFVTGLTRTGTTFLHDLLSIHPIGRSHVLWEQLTAIPETSDESLSAQREDRAKRRQQKKWSYDFGMSLIGTETFERIHRVGYDMPEGK